MSDWVLGVGCDFEPDLWGTSLGDKNLFPPIHHQWYYYYIVVDGSGREESSLIKRKVAGAALWGQKGVGRGFDVIFAAEEDGSASELICQSGSLLLHVDYYYVV